MSSTTRERETGEGLPLLMSCERVARELGINKATLYSRLITPGILPSVIVGERNRRIARQDLLAYVEKLRAGRTGE